MEFSLIALIIGLVVIAFGLLILRFVIKTAITLVKVAFIVAIGLGAWILLQATGLLPS